MNYNNSSQPQADNQLPLQIGNATLGFVGAVTNLLVIWTIFKTKELHNKSQFAIFSHAVVAFLFEAATCFVGLSGFVHYVLNAPPMKQYDCMLLHLPAYITGASDLTATMNLGIDRLIAIKAPGFYKTMSTVRYMITFNLIIWIYALGQLVEAFTLTAPVVGEKTLPFCGFLTSLTPLNQLVTNATGGAMSLLTIGVYVAALVSVGGRYWGTKWVNEAQKNEWARIIQLEAFKTIMILGCIHFCCSAVAVILYTISNIFTSKEGFLLLLYRFGSLLLNLNGTTHLFVYLKCNTTFRSAFMSIVMRQHSTIVIGLQ